MTNKATITITMQIQNSAEQLPRKVIWFKRFRDPRYTLTRLGRPA
jgi:hypothetical protein